MWYAERTERGRACMEDKDILKMARGKMGVSQAKFADYFGVPKRTYQDWEYGTRKMPEYLLQLMLYKLKMEGITEDLTKYMESDEK